jgi:3-methylcrotonyl-CoA carboxylase alpha subunit
VKRHVEAAEVGVADQFEFPGQVVAQGEALLSLEAMKMEHTLIAPFAGKVALLSVSIDDQVAENVMLVRITAAD